MKGDTILRILHILIGLTVIIDGIDKFFNILVDWKIYAAPLILDIWPFSTGAFLGALGVAEIIVGFTFLLHARIGGLMVAGLMAGIAINLLLLGNFYNMIPLNICVGLMSLFIAQQSLLQKN